MRQAAGCGIMPHQFYRMTLGEIMVAVQGAMEGERRQQARQVDATMRAIGATFGNNREPYRGLSDSEPARAISLHEARQLRFWRP